MSRARIIVLILAVSNLAYAPYWACMDRVALAAFSAFVAGASLMQFVYMGLLDDAQRRFKELSAITDKAIGAVEETNQRLEGLWKAK